MAGCETKTIISYVPAKTLVILGLSLLLYYSPGLAGVAIYDRFAILDGQVWRLLFCHFVHFDDAHLVYNCVAFGIAGSIIEHRSYPYFVLLFASSAFSIGLSLLVFKSDVFYYGGLSGPACACFIYVLLSGLRNSGSWRIICFLGIFLFLGKLLLECLTTVSVLPYASDSKFVLVPLSHVVGVSAAWTIYFLSAKKWIGPHSNCVATTSCGGP